MANKSLRKDPLAWIGRRLPMGFQNKFVNTDFYDHYLRLRYHSTKLEEVDFEVADGHTVTIKAPSGSHYHREKNQGRIHEPSLTAELFDELSSDDVFYDIGAHYGYISQLARVAGVPDENIHCFENDTFNKRVLEETVSDTNINVNTSYVGTGSGMISIDDYVEYNEPPTVAKIDAEGSEYDVLSCMKETMRDNSITMYIEIHPGKLPDFNASVEDIESILDDVGYRYETIDHRETDMVWEAVDALPTDSGYLIRTYPDGAN